MEKREKLVEFVSDLGRVQSRAGMRGALDTLKIAEHPAGCGQGREPCGREGYQDPRDREGARPRRDLPRDLDVHARVVDVLGAVQPARLLRRLQTHGRADDAAPLRAAADAPVCAAREPALGSSVCSLLKPRVLNDGSSRASCRHSNTATSNRLSRPGRGRADRAGARLCLQQGGQLGAARLGLDADARQSPRDRARQSRPRPVDQALRSGATITPT